MKRGLVGLVLVLLFSAASLALKFNAEANQPPSPGPRLLAALGRSLESAGYRARVDLRGGLVEGESPDCTVAFGLSRPEGGDDGYLLERYAGSHRIAYLWKGRFTEKRPGIRAQIESYAYRLIAPLRLGIDPKPIYLVSMSSGCRSELIAGLAAPNGEVF
ncbi:hypothetical protein [Prosthecomicrobium sp. N25]|uniref:hypothetical protein n=1 Tax=Prosthecomicrobium sp. N25 TaxID=3129254 RepID=UPI0030783722